MLSTTTSEWAQLRRNTNLSQLEHTVEMQVSIGLLRFVEQQDTRRSAIAEKESSVRPESRNVSESGTRPAL